MKTTKYIADKIRRMPRGYVFSYSDFITDGKNKEAIIKALNRMVASGKLAKLSKGKYYKPQNSVFGILAPDQYQVVKDLLESNGKITGYLTGYSIFNRLGLTTQVSSIIQIGKNEIRPAFKRDFYRITFVRQKNIITKKNIFLLQVLDSMKFIKRIPDSNPNDSCTVFLRIVSKLSLKEKKDMVRLAMKYQPLVRALLGALLEQNREKYLTTSLIKSLNPISKYKIGINTKVLSTAIKWNIE